MRNAKFLAFSALSWAAVHYSPAANIRLANEMSEEQNVLTVVCRRMQSHLCIFLRPASLNALLSPGAGGVIYNVGFASKSQSLCPRHRLPPRRTLLSFGYILYLWLVYQRSRLAWQRLHFAPLALPERERASPSRPRIANRLGISPRSTRK